MVILREAMVGTWKLLTYEMVVYSEKGVTKTSPAGGEPIGFVTFTSDGYMSAYITSTEATVPHEANVWYDAADNEVVRAARCMLTYCGPYHLKQVDGKEVLSTKVDLALDPNWIDTVQDRKATVKDEEGHQVLVLQPVDKFTLENGDKVEVTITWRKILPEEVK